MLPYGAGLVVLLCGPSGTGKTMTVNALARELGKRVLMVDFPSLTGKASAATAARSTPTCDGLSSASADMSNAMLFFDECEVVFRQREHGGDRLLNALLTEIERHEGIVFLATNRAFDLDEAMHRRISTVVEFRAPRRALRRAHLGDAAPAERPDPRRARRRLGRALAQARARGRLHQERGRRRAPARDPPHAQRRPRSRRADAPIEARRRRPRRRGARGAVVAPRPPARGGSDGTAEAVAASVAALPPLRLSDVVVTHADLVEGCKLADARLAAHALERAARRADRRARRARAAAGRARRARERLPLRARARRRVRHVALRLDRRGARGDARRRGRERGVRSAAHEGAQAARGSKRTRASRSSSGRRARASARSRRRSAGSSAGRSRRSTARSSSRRATAAAATTRPRAGSTRSASSSSSTTRGSATALLVLDGFELLLSAAAAAQGEDAPPLARSRDSLDRLDKFPGAVVLGRTRPRSSRGERARSPADLTRRLSAFVHFAAALLDARAELWRKLVPASAPLAADGAGRELAAKHELLPRPR